MADLQEEEVKSKEEINAGSANELEGKIEGESEGVSATSGASVEGGVREGENEGVRRTSCASDEGGEAEDEVAGASSGSAQPTHTPAPDSAHSHAHEPNCTFCRIIMKATPAAILYEDEDFVCFRDHRPAATHHYIVIPRHHIRDPKALTREHIPMVERMVAIGQQVLSDQGGDMEGIRMGFHWPPFILVRHLHLHVVGPESSMGWFSRKILFRVDSFAFSSHTWIVDHLSKMTDK